MIVVLLGAPGSGKGVIGELLVRDFGFRRLSSGDMLRDHVRRGTPLGKKAKPYMDSGALVPDEMILTEPMIGAIRKEIGEAENLILDGFPRTVPQAEALAQMLAGQGKRLDAVLLIDVPEETLVRRLSSRRVCRKCNAIYNILTMPPKKEGVCDVCGGELYQRDDDQEATVRNRIAIYRKSTEPLVGYYDRNGSLRRMNGQGELDEVYARAREALGL